MGTKKVIECPYCGKKINVGAALAAVKTVKKAAGSSGNGKSGGKTAKAQEKLKPATGNKQVFDKGVNHCIAAIDAAVIKSRKAGKSTDARLEKMIELIFSDRDGLNIGDISSLRKLAKGSYNSGKHVPSGLGDYSDIAKTLLMKLEM